MDKRTVGDEKGRIEEGLEGLIAWENDCPGRALPEERGGGDVFYAGICAGICPDEAERVSARSLGEFNQIRFRVFNCMEEAFRGGKAGAAVKKDRDVMYLAGVFPAWERETFIKDSVEHVCLQVERESGAKICVGVGSPVVDPAGLRQSFEEAKAAFDLYPFEGRKVIDFDTVHTESREAFEDYKVDVDLAFRGILTKDGRVMEQIDRVMDDIEALHYGNWKAVVMRTMIFTGDLGFLLGQYRLLDVDFYEMQDALQAQVEAQYTMEDLRKCVHGYYEDLIPRIYAKGRSQEKVLIEDVKKYIRDHYAEDLSIRELAAVACVSPNYFSAMFKKETGQNYKAYLTALRLEEALRLLQETDYKTYEIAEKVGYNSVRRFVDTFKQHYGVSPMEYKKGLHREG